MAALRVLCSRAEGPVAQDVVLYSICCLMPPLDINMVLQL
jgi:hypothetical protein